MFSDFYSSQASKDRLQSICKTCAKTKKKQWEKENPDKVRQYQKKKYDKLYKENTEYKKKRTDYYSNYYMLNGRKRSENYQEVIVIWQKKNQEKKKAHRLINKALRKGVISKTKYCQECKKEKRLSAHHNDYSQPLLVEWLCSSCHKLRHLIIK